MTHSFTATGPGALARTDEGVRRTVLVTGAAGRIGSDFAERYAERYDLRLMVRRPPEDGGLERWGEVVTGTLDDLDGLKRLCAGVDTVLHLAADASPSATWGSVLPTNIVGTYNVYVAAKAAGCRRVVYASSIHAVSGYGPDVQVKTSEPPNPGDLYGVSKVFGEALGRYMAEQEGLSVIAVRIGGFQPPETARDPGNVGMLDAFVSERDLAQLLARCIDVEGLRWAVLHGLSGNRYNRLDISDARALLGYAPEDDAFALNPVAAALAEPENIETHNLASGQESGLREEL